jgi:hypothetical protein
VEQLRKRKKVQDHKNLNGIANLKTCMKSSKKDGAFSS